MRKNNSAFTLIEVLVTAVIASIIFVALFGAFSSGVRLWRRLSARMAGEQFALFCERFHTDLGGCFDYSVIPFAGGEQELAFCSLVASPGKPLKGIGRVTYAFAGDAVTRRADDYAGVYADRDGSGRAVLGGLKEFSLDYYFLDSLKKEFRWAQEWVEKGLPLAVRMRAEFNDGRVFKRTFAIPAGGGGV